MATVLPGLCEGRLEMVWRLCEGTGSPHREDQSMILVCAGLNLAVQHCERQANDAYQ